MSSQELEASRLLEESRRIAGFPALIHKFLDSAAEAVVIIDKHGSIVFFNRKAVFLFGWLPEEVMGKQVDILLPDALQKGHAEHRASYMRDPRPRAMGANLDLKGKHKDGSELDLLIDLHPEMGLDGPYVRAAIRRADPTGPDKNTPSPHNHSRS